MAGETTTTAPAVQVDHVSTYRFDRPVRLSTHTLRLRPADRSPAPVEHDFQVVPVATTTWHSSDDGEWTGRLDVRGRVTGLMLESSFTTTVPTVDPLAALGGGADPARVPPAFSTASETARSVQARIRHVEDHGSVVRAVDEVLASGTGSCRDSSMVLVHQMARVGLTARFVAGYLIRLAGHDDLVRGPWPSVIPAEEDSTAYHAWVEVWLDELGWVPFDPTTGRPGGGGHVPVASGDRPRETLPVEGASERARVTLAVDHRIRRL